MHLSYFLTAKAMKEDTLQGFKVGAPSRGLYDQPFSMENFWHVSKQFWEEAKNKLLKMQLKVIFSWWSAYEFDAEKATIISCRSAKLTSKEIELLKLLCENIGKPVSRSFALKMVWGDDTYFNARSMDAYIRKLRKFLKKEPTIQIINLHGEGFKLVS